MDDLIADARIQITSDPISLFTHGEQQRLASYRLSSGSRRLTPRQLTSRMHVITLFTFKCFLFPTPLKWSIVKAHLNCDFSPLGSDALHRVQAQQEVICKKNNLCERSTLTATVNAL